MPDDGVGQMAAFLNLFLREFIEINRKKVTNINHLNILRFFSGLLGEKMLQPHSWGLFWGGDY